MRDVVIDKLHARTTKLGDEVVWARDGDWTTREIRDQAGSHLGISAGEQPTSCKDVLAKLGIHLDFQCVRPFSALTVDLSWLRNSYLISALI